MSLPLILRKSINALIVGGGDVALRKCRTLLEAGAAVTVISPELDYEFNLLCPEYPQKLQIIRSEYEGCELKDFTLVFACTDSREVNNQITCHARKAGVPVNVSDSPEDCDFTLPANFCSDNLSAGFSCDNLPALAAALRDKFAESLPENYQRTIRQIRSIREKLISGQPEQKKRAVQMRKICRVEILEQCSKMSEVDAEKFLNSLLAD